jgi:hypothetical protein
MLDLITNFLFYGLLLLAASTIPKLLTRLEDPLAVFLARILGKEIKKPPPPTYKERISVLVKKLESASSDADELLMEIGEVAQKREKSVKQLEKEVSLMEGREEELKLRIADLENIPVPVADHFGRIVNAGEKKSARREALYFFLGALFSLGAEFLFRLI